MPSSSLISSSAPSPYTLGIEVGSGADRWLLDIAKFEAENRLQFADRFTPADAR
jgi:hypothetical protein